MALPEHGLSKDEIFTHLDAVRAEDKDWRGGRCFSLVFSAGDEVEEIARDASTMYLAENALNPLAFPSLGRLQHDVVEMVAGMLHGGEEAAGFMTSGGTESILMAVKAARTRGAEQGITEPEMVLATSAHAAFHKAASYFGVTIRQIPVREDWTADVDAMADALTERSVLLVGSAPQYPQGVMDPIPDLAALALDRGCNLHVDACMGGFVLPFMEQLGEEVPPWDFRVPGVTSISADIHKLGYSPKGASVLVHRNAELRAHQVFVFDDWLGGFYASSGMAGTKPAGPIAAAWAVMHHLGAEGYRRNVAITLEASRALVDGVRAIPGLTVLGEPIAHNIAIAAEDPERLDIFKVDIFKVMDELATRGWHLDRQSPPDSLHATVSVGTAPQVGALLADLGEAVEVVGAGRTDDRSTDYASLE